MPLPRGAESIAHPFNLVVGSGRVRRRQGSVLTLFDLEMRTSHGCMTSFSHWVMRGMSLHGWSSKGPLMRSASEDHSERHGLRDGTKQTRGREMRVFGCVMNPRLCHIRISRIERLRIYLEILASLGINDPVDIGPYDFSRRVFVLDHVSSFFSSSLIYSCIIKLSNIYRLLQGDNL